MRFRRIAPWVAAGLVVAGVAFSVLLNDLAGSHGEDTWTGVAWAAAALASSGVGLVLAIRRGGNPIGWLLLANGLALAVHQVATPYADYAVLEDRDALPVAEWAVLIHERAWPTLFICPTAIALVFPDGWLPAEEAHVDASGRVVHELPAAGRAHTQVRRGGLQLATVVHDAALDARPDLLKSVIEAGALAVEIARLRVEVRRRLAEVEESRARTSPRATRSGVGWSATCTTVRNSAWSPSGWHCATSRAGSPRRAARRGSSTPQLPNSAMRSRRCASLPAGSGRPASTADLRPRCASSRRARPCGPASRPPTSASSIAWKPPPTSCRAKR
jgi:hypothetical protein